jgi:hypothetical protein
MPKPILLHSHHSLGAKVRIKVKSEK